jgi:sugar O-acyltransferase (sialic acid O-acetyltransferase NeuD family)
MNKKIIIIGGGGHAKVLLEILLRLKLDIYAVVAPQIDTKSGLFKGLRHYVSDDAVLKYSTDQVVLVNGVGSLPGNTIRRSIFDKFDHDGYEFLTVASDLAIVSSYCTLGMGVQIMPGAIINADTHIGDNCIINSGAIIEHDCTLGHSVHIAPGATLSGGVECGDYVHVGAGANIIQGISIASGATVGAGATATKNIIGSATLFGAKPFLSKGLAK